MRWLDNSTWREVGGKVEVQETGGGVRVVAQWPKWSWLDLADG